MKTTAKQIGIIVLASAVLAVVYNAVQPRRIPWVQDWSQQVESKATQKGIRIIPLAAVADRISASNVVFIDARTRDEYAKGHIQGAISVPFGNIDERYSVIANLIDSGMELIVYCSNRECDDALLLASELKKMGCSNIAIFIDGFDSWVSHGGEVEQ